MPSENQIATYSDLVAKRAEIGRILKKHSGAQPRVVLDESLLRARMGMEKGMLRPTQKGNARNHPVSMVVRMGKNATMGDLVSIQNEVTEALGRQVDVKSEGGINKLALKVAVAL